MVNKKYFNLKALRTVVKEVGNVKDTACLLGVSYSYMRTMLCGLQQVSPKLVKKMVELSNGKVAPKDLRPDIF